MSFHVRQFAIHLSDTGAARYNFYRLRNLERIIALGWRLHDRIEYSTDATILVFQTERDDVPTVESEWPYEVKS